MKIELENKKYIRIKTKYLLTDINCQEFEGSKIFAYNCPICFRFFDNILKTECCQNYFCHFCVKKIYQKAKKSGKLSLECSFCSKEKPSFIDIDKKDQIRTYIDSSLAIEDENLSLLVFQLQHIH